ncbi:TorD/DmsD family molecular chaperone [Candidatus Magnetominusculus xianensis]|uniref:Anaerobic dehydrogenase subunit n=1 Tax=Candidatus Magnetominusculus xianensis TaxID=1748249 RepID=A0ABR5SIS0_9BACT|nr:molecular chaperone TorD family protein [Candidatus Magnetominusculus xianensis]KWT84152.1 anaerobic dehydrogenase subunit [Candidatus Magnetominusculus xianensis]MBF0402444.1 molecular chaperone TorD family protein [Nitrospirota bacterium]
MNEVEYDIAAANLRSKVYGLLAQGFRDPDELLVESLETGYVSGLRSLVEHMEGGESFLPLFTKLDGIIGQLDYDKLKEQYGALFLAAGGLSASPYEAEYTKETPQHSFSSQAQLADIAGFYLSFGLDVSQRTPERVDHIATELEYMQIMSMKEALALKDNHEENATVTIDAQRKFITDHLGRWTGKLAERISQCGISEFYETLAEILDVWMGFDKAYLNAA